VFAEIADIAMVDVLMRARGVKMLAKRCVSRLTPHHAILLQRLTLRLPSWFGVRAT
jgi:hypothetical protein